jgi:5-deoxy-glucuronate isomerase
MIGRLDKVKVGYNTITDLTNQDHNMLMDVGVFKLSAGNESIFLKKDKETAFLLLTGKATISWDGQEKTVERKSVFDEEPWCLHVAKNTEVTIKALKDCEILIQKTENDKNFASKLYSPEECNSVEFGKGVWDETARRLVRTIFDYSNAPYSNMVMGEVITYPGRWSSYIPHHHPQPEVYYYQFDKPQGFGCSIIGDDVYKVGDKSFSMIPGGVVHPQTSAPGYAMYYCWMIRHLDDNPWTDRINEKCHEWLLDENVKIWSRK